MGDGKIHRSPCQTSPLAPAAAVSLALVGDALLYAVLPSQAADVGMPLALVGLLLSVNRLVRFATNSLAGVIYARRRRQGPFLVAMLGASATTMAYALPLGIWPLLVARALWGTCWSFLRLGQLLAVLERAGTDERGNWVGRAQAVSRIGTVFALLLGGYLTDTIGYSRTVILFGALTAVGAGVAWCDWRQARHGEHQGILIPIPGSGDYALDAGENPKQGVQVTSATDVPSIISPSSASGSAVGLAAVGSSRAAAYISCLLLTYIGGFSQGFTTFGLIMGTLALLLLQRFGQSVTLLGTTVGVATLSGWLLGARWILELTIAPTGGRLADRFGRSNVVGAGALLQAMMLSVVALSTEPWVMMLAFCGLFAAAVVFGVSLDAAATDVAARARPAAVMSRYNTAVDMGAALGPYVGFSLGETIGLPTLYMGVAVVLTIVGGLFVAGFNRFETARRNPAI